MSIFARKPVVKPSSPVKGKAMGTPMSTSRGKADVRIEGLTVTVNSINSRLGHVEGLTRAIKGNVTRIVADVAGLKDGMAILESDK